MTWTREHDKLLADRCEGLEVVQIDGKYYTPKTADGKSFYSYYGGPAELANYNLHVALAFRAAEAWRVQDARNRWFLQSPVVNCNNNFHAIAYCMGRGKSSSVNADTPAEALAWALYEAVSA